MPKYQKKKKKEKKRKTLPSGWEKKDRVIDALRRRLKQENTHPPPFYSILSYSVTQHFPRFYSVSVATRFLSHLPCVYVVPLLS